MSDNGSWYDYDEYLQPKHLKGKRVTLQIVRTAEIEVNERGEKKIKPVLYFKGTAKYLFLNKTMRAALSEMFGDQKSACVGKSISIRAAKLAGRKDGQETIEILPPEDKKPSAPLPASGTSKSALDQVWDLASLHEEAKEAIEQLLSDHGGDADASLEALKRKYAEVKA